MKKVYLYVLVLAFIFGGCAPKDIGIHPTDRTKQEEIKEIPKEKDIKGLTLIESISPYIGKRDGGDCSGFVSLINQKNGNIFFDPNELNSYFDNNRKSKAIYNLYKSKGKINLTQTPKVGDLVFFSIADRPRVQKNQKDKKQKRDQKDDNPNITHIGIVYSIETDGTVKFIHHSDGRNIFDYINIYKPTTQKEGLRIINSYLKRCRGAKAECLAPAFFKGFGTIDS